MQAISQKQGAVIYASQIAVLHFRLKTAHEKTARVGRFVLQEFFK